MKIYTTLLFDVDDTLLDFDATESLALKLLFEEYQFSLTPEIEMNYKNINKRFWEAFEEGKIDRDVVMNTRFSTLFKEYGQDVDGVLLEKSFRSYLEQDHQLINGATEVISELHPQFDLYIVTNGDSKTQDRRLRDSGLFPFFKDIFVSEAIGFQKPMKEYFDYVFARIPQFAKKQTLIIGDSLSSDIKGGNLAGIDTCWYNPKMKPNNTDIVPIYEIQKLEELYQILAVNEKRATAM
ncbi:MAG TPA: YjjG family noncanonical pyrimidine nucleotidase [Bacillales bacterium]|nr:YjjG family noncanonical pyrimidine nucleotidase [Bacillales bacterium]